MGCICSKGGSDINGYVENQREKECIKSSKPLYASSKREAIVVQVDGGSGSNGARARLLSKPSSKEIVVSTPRSEDGEKKPFVKEKPLVVHHQRRATPDNGVHLVEPPVCRIVSMPHAIEAEQVAAGWPSWLTSVAAEAIKGWLPRRADSFEKLDKIGQGTYSNVYRARDLETGKIVALKKVRFVNMDPESVRFMAREIHILRRLDHPNVIKLEGLITSRMSGSLYLVFEYMEHDLSGLAASPDIKFSEKQIKCYMQQLLRGLEHCHSRGVLHRDIKGSNLLIDNNGILRIADFGLATFFQPDQKQPLTSRVVTLWYRPPELLLGATQYGDGVDLWSAGCILAELLMGKPIMPGRTEVEQLHKIFKLCGSPSEDYWRKARLPHTTIFKPQHPYRRCVSETFNHIPFSSLALIEVLLSVEPEGRRSATSALKSEFFTTKPHPCDPSSLPKYRPSKEFDAKLRNEEARRQRAAAMKGRGSESQRRGSRDAKAVPGQDASAEKRHTNPNPRSISEKEEDSSRAGFPIVRSRGTAQNGFFHSGPLMHPGAFGSSRVKTVKEDDTEVGPVRVCGPSRNGPESKTQRSHVPDGTTVSDHKLNGRFNQHDDVQPSENRWAHHLVDGLTTSQKEVDRVFIKDSTTSYIPKKNRIHYSGPLMPPGGNMDEMLKEHERQIQQAVRKARIDKTKMKIYSGNGQSEALLITGRNGR